MKYRGVETWCEKYQCKHKLHDASEFEIKIDFCRFDWFVLVTSIKVSFNHKLSTKIVKIQNHYFVSIKTFKLAVDLYRVDDYHLTVISYMKSPLNLKSKHCYLDDSYEWIQNSLTTKTMNVMPQSFCDKDEFHSNNWSKLPFLNHEKLQLL